MEATSARMAQRYQFDGFPPPKSPLQRYIYNACDPVSNFEPNLALNLEIVDMINSKKGSAPREAAVTIVQIINHRNPNVSLLALSLLDNCVKNCGYPFHLQISTKEFLNELVRRFPERPPLRASRVQGKILEAIEEWRQTICQTSRYKEDLGFIRDMHRLLLYKGYMFPEVRSEDAAVLNSSDDLRSAEEMEEEERAAQSAKLQELIRRGTPHDLQEANRLMKVMAGYDTRHKTDYRAKAAEEVVKVQQKAKLLEEMLQNHRDGDQIGDGDVFEELAAALQSAHPKIQRMCEEESDDAEAVAKLLEINDSIHRTVERYKLMKSGDIAAANNIPKGTLGTTTGVGKNAANELSLIDFDPEAPAAATTNQTSNGGLLDESVTPGQTTQTSVEDDLLGLSLGNSSTPATGGISLGGAMLSNLYAQSSSPAPFSPPAYSGPSAASSLPPTQSSRPSSNAFAGISTPLPASKPNTPTPYQSKPGPAATQHTDPFAALVSAGSRPTTPSRQQNGNHKTSANHQPSNLISTSTAGATGEDDDWTFTSSLPPSQPAVSSLPARHTSQIHSSSYITIELESIRRPSPHENSVMIIAYFSNPSTTQALSQLHFQVAFGKSYTLSLRPQSSREVPPSSRRGVKQEMLLGNIAVGKGDEVKMKFKVGFSVGGQAREEMGMVNGLGIS